MSANEVTASHLLGRLDPVVWIVTAADGPRRGGLVATNVVSASIVPELPRVAVGLARQHHTWQLVEATGCLTLHLIAARHLDWVWRFGLASGHQGDKFVGLSCETGPNGCPILLGAVGWLAGRVEARLDTGDRTIFLTEVVAAGGSNDGDLLTVSALLARATPEQKAELRRLITRDAAIDAAAIQQWRGRA